MESLCQACLEKNCICLSRNTYCDECGGACDGAHSIMRSKTANEKAEEIAKTVLSYGPEVSKLVVNYITSALKE